MPADIVKRPYLTILAAHDQGALTKNVEAEILAGFGNVADMAGQLPVAAEQDVTLKVQQLAIGVGPGWQARAVPLVWNTVVTTIHRI